MEDQLQRHQNNRTILWEHPTGNYSRNNCNPVHTWQTFYQTQTVSLKEKIKLRLISQAKPAGVN